MGKEKNKEAKINVNQKYTSIIKKKLVENGF